MRKTVPILVSVGLGILIACGLTVVASSWAVADPKPNIVFVYTDDQDAATLQRDVMPKTFDNLVAQGVLFENMFNSTALCCPTRVTYLRGQYSHNHRVFSNDFPSGGYEKFRAMGYRDKQLPVWLKSAGYATAHVGRVMNGYHTFSPEIPSGWDRWVALTREMNQTEYQINDNGRVYNMKRATEQDVDHLSRKAVEFVRNHAPTDKPFYLQVSAFQPHTPYFYPDRYASAYSYRKAPRTPNFNEEDVSDKPSYVKKRSLLSDARVAQLDEDYRNRLRGLRGVDDLVGALASELRRQGEWENTVFIFSSDNGYDLGNRRIVGKIDPYEEDINIPLVVRGPNVRRGVVETRLASTNDVVPTIMDFAGTPSKPFFDGRSLKPLARGTSPLKWRTAVGIEYLPTFDESKGARLPFFGVRTEKGEKYVHYPQTREEEYYDLRNDPYELENGASDPRNAARVTALKVLAEKIRSCSGISCRGVEGPLTVELTAPADGASVRATVPLAARAAGPLGVQRVEFLVDGNLVHTDRSTPYSFSWDTKSMLDHRATITVKAHDAAGNNTRHSRTVTVDNTAPGVKRVVPAARAKGVYSSANVYATFSERMIPASVSKKSFKLFRRDSSRSVWAKVSYNAVKREARLDPTNKLRADTTYRAVITTGAKDLAGNSLSRSKGWYFTTRR